MLTKSIVCNAISEVCDAIWRSLNTEYLKAPTTEQEWLNIEEGFNGTWDFPHCIGAIDGKHVVIQSPANFGSAFFNYKKLFSIVLLAVCDANYNFTMIDVRCPGQFSDGGVFSNFKIGQRSENGEFNFPTPCSLPGTDNVLCPYVFA